MATEFKSEHQGHESADLVKVVRKRNISSSSSSSSSCSTCSSSCTSASSDEEGSREGERKKKRGGCGALRAKKRDASEGPPCPENPDYYGESEDAGSDGEESGTDGEESGTVDQRESTGEEGVERAKPSESPCVDEDEPSRELRTPDPPAATEFDVDVIKAKSSEEDDDEDHRSLKSGEAHPSAMGSVDKEPSKGKSRRGSGNTVSHLKVALSEYIKRLEELEAEEDASGPNVCDLFWLKDDLGSSKWTARPTEPNPVYDNIPHFEIPQLGGSSCLSNEFLNARLDLSAYCVGGSQTSHATYQKTSQGSQQSPSQRGAKPQCPRNEYCYPTPPESEVIQAQDYRHGGIQTPPEHARKLQREDAPRVQEQQQQQKKHEQQQQPQQQQQQQKKHEQQQQQQQQQQEPTAEHPHHQHHDHTSTDPQVEEDESVAGSREQCAGLSSSQLIGLITCVACSRVFNRVVVCHGYLLQLNRPVQCLCGCVICTLCYRTHRGCLKHSVSSAHGPVNATTRYLAECPQLESVGTWDLGRDEADRFKTGNEVNDCVCRMIENCVPTASEQRKQILLAMWCTTVLAAGEHRETVMVPLINSSLRGKVTDAAFRRMLHYLREWFVIHCKPSDGPTLIHLISKLTANSGMRVSTAPSVRLLRKRVFGVDANMFAANNAAAKLFDYTSRGEAEEAHNYINVTEEYHRLTERARGQLTQYICTNRDYYGLCDGKDVAVKISNHKRCQLSMRQEMQVQTEIVMLDRLESPSFGGVLRLLDYYREGDCWFIIMEKPRVSQDLFDYVTDKGCLSEDTARTFLLQILEASRHCHSRGVIHMDLKEDNMLVDLDLKLIDFLSRRTAKSSEGDYNSKPGSLTPAGT
ncbi:hypothetical protein Q5P01_024032 [Channa striata]|uniref:non-specific serine/threonine protein kinase n=1 Tax=Channa striata TaxID=64152 RepID=A0AA88LLN2_CHASR|nr:hypothetical protein Q5P01_024032 [Channa striata]